MSSVGDTHASHLAQQASDKEKEMQGIYGPGLGSALLSYDLDTQCWRTYAVTCLWGSEPYLETWPPSGMTRSGKSYLQQRLVRHIGETGYSLWPTPTTTDCYTDKLSSTQHKEGSMHSVTLAQAVQMWPTPTTQEVEHPKAQLTATGRRQSTDGTTSHSMGLADAVQMWPTPVANDAKNPYARIREHSQSIMLGEAVLNADPSTSGGRLNPTWVEWLMGFPTGWTDLDA